MLRACIRPGPGEAVGGYASSPEVLALALEAPIGRVTGLSTRLPQSAVIEVAAVVVAFAVSIAAAVVLYRLVEKPSRIGHGEKSRATHQEIRLLDARSPSSPEHSRSAAP